MRCRLNAWRVTGFEHPRVLGDDVAASLPHDGRERREEPRFVVGADVAQGADSRAEREPGLRTPSSHSARRLLYSEEASEWRTPLLTTTIFSPGGISMVSCASDRQSSSSALPWSPNVEAIWSMIPHATPTKPFSASRASLATSSDGSSKPPSFDKRSAVATS